MIGTRLEPQPRRNREGRGDAPWIGCSVRGTSLKGRNKTLYEKVYCARENLIMDLKLYTRADKTAYHRWEANQFRLFLHMGA